MQIEENGRMASEEELSFNHEYQITKKKCERFKSEIVEYKSEIKQLRGLEIKYDILKDKLEEIELDS